MHFSRFAPATAGLIGAAQALVPVHIGADADLSAARFDCAKSWDNEVLFSGIAGVATETNAAVELDLSLVEAQVEGNINIGALDDFLAEPTLRLNLAGVKAYVELDISASAGVYQSVELVASPELEVDTGLLEVSLGAAFALDLVVGVGAAVDVSAGFYVAFGDEDYIDVSVVSKEVVGSSLVGLVTKALPVTVGADVDLSAEIEIQLGLRLRSHVSIEAGIDLLDLDLVEAGAEVAIWADLLSHTIVLVETEQCAVAIDNKFALSLGLAVEISASVLDLLDISLAPEVTVTLATAIGVQVCMPDRGEVPDRPLPTVTPTSGSGSPNATITSGEMVTSTVTTTKEYTITSCHVSVPNCPASHTEVIVTSTVLSSVTVCPVDGPTPTATTTKPVHTITETLTTVVPCEPTTSTFTPPPANPTSVPTDECDSTTVCPSETGGEEQPPVPTEVPSVTTPAPTMPTFVPTSVPTWSHPAPNSTWTSIVTPPGTGFPPPPPAETPLPPPEVPSPPPTAGAGSIKVGFALALPAVVAMML
ncbi:hypothetical protein ACRE_076810 [Hapsidospora chrysogenum ATCC 11550]|uniref:Uncharacterized protein n=1 Tax=Hapsidospora chrysogenum (strain ATCC 11550 / CBS 779.69 / DSM 880 / IAM 14645 / JCM 23072 / IMI 49137) TaxID=857340 RepID=A0A086SWX0_HAPC1|nr:hypothetical protein ACRE_076810 [Hapsidospora chrysogenum ATCC 11550]